MKHKVSAIFITFVCIMLSICGCSNDDKKPTGSESTYSRVLVYFVENYGYKDSGAYAGEYIDIETRQLTVLVAHKQNAVEFEQEVSKLKQQYRYSDAIFKSADYAYSYIRGLSELIHDLYISKQEEFASPWQYLQGWGVIDYKNCVEVTFKYLDNNKQEKFLNDIASAIAKEANIIEIDDIKDDIKKALIIINNNSVMPTDEEMAAWGEYEDILKYFSAPEYSEVFAGAYFENFEKNLVVLITYDENTEGFEEVKKDVNKIVQRDSVVFKSAKHSYKYLERVHYEIERHRKDKNLKDNNVWSNVKGSTIVYKSNNIKVDVPPSFQADDKIDIFVDELVIAIHGQEHGMDFENIRGKLKDILYFNFNYN